jgi:D-tyrosyl-tRNA(Tyr) deacylase
VPRLGTDPFTTPLQTGVPLYQALVQRLSTDLGKPVQTGEFGADMQVDLTNDGPVTLIIDSKMRE